MTGIITFLVNFLSWVLLLLVLAPSIYWLAMAVASIFKPKPLPRRSRTAGPPTPQTRFAIVVPAHDEESVIARTVRRMCAMDYPPELFEVHVVADYCKDRTAALAAEAGAQVHERNQGPRRGKGAALSWLLGSILQRSDRGRFDAVVIFDADTQVDSQFLTIMDAHMYAGEQVIQGQHVISNPRRGWFPALTWAMFLIDNRYQNLGRNNLGWSSKHMGDSICFRSDILINAGWGEGLTEDYQLRQRLLLDGIKIIYEPAAIGWGEAPLTWQQAEKQRARWLRGTFDANRKVARHLLDEAIRQRSGMLLDGALQAFVPSYSSLTLVSAAALFVQLFANFLFASILFEQIFGTALLVAWAVLVWILFLYPLFGLALERAPLRGYLAILSGPVFILWRSALAIKSRYGSKVVPWVRTAHGK